MEKLSKPSVVWKILAVKMLFWTSWERQQTLACWTARALIKRVLCFVILTTYTAKNSQCHPFLLPVMYLHLLRLCVMRSLRLQKGLKTSTLSSKDSWQLFNKNTARDVKDFTWKGFSLKAGHINLDKQGAQPVRMTQIAVLLGSIK